MNGQRSGGSFDEQDQTLLRHSLVQVKTRSLQHETGRHRRDLYAHLDTTLLIIRTESCSVVRATVHYQRGGCLYEHRAMKTLRPRISSVRDSVRTLLTAVTPFVLGTLIQAYTEEKWIAPRRIPFIGGGCQSNLCPRLVLSVIASCLFLWAACSSSTVSPVPASPVTAVSGNVGLNHASMDISPSGTLLYAVHDAPGTLFEGYGLVMRIDLDHREWSDFDTLRYCASVTVSPLSGKVAIVEADEVRGDRVRLAEYDSTGSRRNLFWPSQFCTVQCARYVDDTTLLVLFMETPNTYKLATFRFGVGFLDTLTTLQGVWDPYHTIAVSPSNRIVLYTEANPARKVHVYDVTSRRDSILRTSDGVPVAAKWLAYAPSGDSLAYIRPSVVPFPPTEGPHDSTVDVLNLRSLDSHPLPLGYFDAQSVRSCVWTSNGTSLLFSAGALTIFQIPAHYALLRYSFR